MQRVHARGQSNRWQRLLSAATRVHTKPSRLRLKISRTANKPGPHLVMTQRRVTDGHTSGTTNTPRLCRRLGSQHIPSRPKRFISTAQLPPTLHVVWFGTSENVDSVLSRVCFTDYINTSAQCFFLTPAQYSFNMSSPKLSATCSTRDMRAVCISQICD